MEEMIINIFHTELSGLDCILASDIYQYTTNVLLYKRGTILTKEKIEKLKNFGIISIPVYLPTDIKIQESNEEIVRRKLELDFDEIYEYANEIVLSVLNKKDIRDAITKIDLSVYNHSHKVALLSTMLGMNLQNFDQSKLEELAVSSLLHDIGKSTIDFSILNKPGRLTEEEYETIKQHSQNGYDILTSTGLFSKEICEAVLSHHENEDGTGYPNQQVENEIPLYSRIIHICDVYSALITKRCYKEAWSIEQAIELLDRDKKNYEPNLLEIFKTSLPIYMKDDVVLLSTNELATVIETYSNQLLVKVFGDKKIVNVSGNENSVHVKKKIHVNKGI